MSESERLVPVFMPPLSSWLLAAEDKKGSPLTETEVIRIRDASPCIMMDREDAQKLAESRGYRDIDPENCWHDWQMVRREMGREPELPAGPSFFQVPREDEDFQRTIEQARRSLAQFRHLMIELSNTAATPMIKVVIHEQGRRAYMWLSKVTQTDEGFSGELFEVPTDFNSYAVGDRLTASADEIFDWMVNDNGRLHGGYSLRYQRAQMSPTEQASFDEYIGVSDYAPLPFDSNGT